LTRKEVTMSVVSPQDRLAGAWNFSAVHSAITFSTAYGVSWNADRPGGGRALSDEVTLTAGLEFVQAA
jgi:hypothetical protein